MCWDSMDQSAISLNTYLRERSPFSLQAKISKGSSSDSPQFKQEPIAARVQPEPRRWFSILQLY